MTLSISVADLIADARLLAESALGSTVGKRGASSRESFVSGRRLCGAHNPGITGGHRRAVGATIATVAKA